MAEFLMECEVERLKPYPDNPRRGDVPAIMRSLERFGQRSPIVVQRSTGYVVKGNNTLEAAKRLGWAKVNILVTDMDDDEARAYLIADNATSDKATYDDQELYKVLTAVLDDGGLEGTGYDLDAFETLADALGAGTVEETDTGEAIRTQAEGVTPRGREEDGPREPMRDIVLLMPVSASREFGAQVAALQARYGTNTVVDTVRRAVAEAVDLPSSGAA